ncbi:MAG: HEAT repeat domain-containing protein [Candidatus Aminicenantes bacterium]|nr:MAG: HEAT repeat domain-containing protein [Candidatus Aminicenantes bacterium]
MNTSLLIVTYSLIFLLGFSFLLFFYLIIRRIVVQHQENSFQKKYAEIEKDILDIVTFPDKNLAKKIAKKYRYYPYVLTRVLVNYIEQIEGLAREQLQKIFNIALKKKCLKDIHSKRQIKRLKATHLFVIFSDPSDMKHIVTLLNDKPIVKLVAITALSRIPSSQTLTYIFQSFVRDSIVNARVYINILFGLGSKIELHVRKYLHKSLSWEKLSLLIELVGAIPLRSLYQDILPFAEHPNKEIRIKVARALGHMRIPASLNILTNLSEDEAWEVSAQALKSLGKLGDIASLDVLSEALFSPFWHVRFNAGHGLASLGSTGMKQLKKIKRQKKDRFASDMATMVLDETILVGEA